VSTAANTARQFRIFCEVIGVAQVLDDPALLDVAGLNAGNAFVAATDAPRLQAILAEAVGKLAAADLEARLTAKDVPCAQLITLAAFVKRALAGGMVTLPARQTTYGKGTLTDFGGGFRADRQDGAALAPAPRLGQHTAALLSSIGVPQSEIEALTGQGHIKLV
jgi:crotonobetainyl-CoA:carnitine CoA-transferase CaiB-like acyl-CoA transferase